MFTAVQQIVEQGLHQFFIQRTLFQLNPPVHLQHDVTAAAVFHKQRQCPHKTVLHYLIVIQRRHVH